jgi:hypothetical protein
MIRALITIAAAALLGTGAGCAFIRKDSPISRSDASPADDREKQWDGKIRHDLDPLKKRFKNLGDDYTATWAGGAYGINAGRGAPGMTAYWLDAVIHLNPVITRDLEERIGDAASHETPTIKKELRGEIPSGTALTSGALNKFVNIEDTESNPAESGGARVYLYPDQNVLVLNYFQGG